MTHVKAARFVAAVPDLCFAVAADVDSYHTFLPLLSHSKVTSERKPLPDGERFDAELTVAYAKLSLRETFVSTVVTDRKRRTVTATSTDGPFTSLMAQWRITPASGGSDINVVIDYRFKSMLLQIAAAAAMETAVQKVMAAFEHHVKSRQSTPA